MICYIDCPLKNFPLLLIPALLLSVFLLFSSGKDQKRFDAFSKEMFEKEMTADTLNMHYTVAAPENYGISEYTPVLSCYSQASEEEARRDLDRYLAVLSSVSPKSWTKTPPMLVFCFPGRCPCPGRAMTFPTMRSLFPLPPACSRSCPFC